MSKESEYLRDKAIRARRLSQTVSDTQSSRTLTEVAQKHEDDANQLELADRSTDGAIQKPYPRDGWVSVALSEIDGLK
ncbi:hypothetical protein JQ616_13175 [Bradyrhizobium tropiciagri]|uniref:hypothetical protein n=1 Tax=Bradyrhizobium tropiciagri TaxID=312253 RepID=UPI001BADDC52|nr:hypothetical protein [Bradyrhizobium tropiciagri]MBR0895909.1 hypothetical protein [Bradyrhizobium tropiciagri]